MSKSLLKIKYISLLVLSLLAISVPTISYADNMNISSEEDLVRALVYTSNEDNNKDLLTANSEESVLRKYEKELKQSAAYLRQDFVFSGIESNISNPSNSETRVHVDCFDYELDLNKNPAIIVAAPFDESEGKTEITIRFTSSSEGKFKALLQDGSYIGLCDLAVSSELVQSNQRDEKLLSLIFNNRTLEDASYYIDDYDKYFAIKLVSPEEKILISSVSIEFQKGGCSYVEGMMQGDESYLPIASAGFYSNNVIEEIRYNINDDGIITSVSADSKITLIQDTNSIRSFKMNYLYDADIEQTNIIESKIESNFGNITENNTDINQDINNTIINDNDINNETDEYDESLLEIEEDESNYLDLSENSSTIYTDIYQFSNGKDYLSFSHSSGLFGSDILSKIYLNNTKMNLDSSSIPNPESLLGLEFNPKNYANFSGIIVNAAKDSIYAGELSVELEDELTESNGIENEEVSIASPSDAKKNRKVCKTFKKGNDESYTYSNDEAIRLTEDRLRRISYCALDKIGTVIAVYDKYGRLINLLSEYSENDIYSYVIIPENENYSTDESFIEKITITYNDILAELDEYAKVEFTDSDYSTITPSVIISGNINPDSESSLTLNIDYNDKYYSIQKNTLEEGISFESVDNWTLKDQLEFCLDDSDGDESGVNVDLYDVDDPDYQLEVSNVEAGEEKHEDNVKVQKQNNNEIIDNSKGLTNESSESTEIESVEEDIAQNTDVEITSEDEKSVVNQDQEDSNKLVVADGNIDVATNDIINKYESECECSISEMGLIENDNVFNINENNTTENNQMIDNITENPDSSENYLAETDTERSDSMVNTKDNCIIENNDANIQMKKNSGIKNDNIQNDSELIDENSGISNEDMQNVFELIEGMDGFDKENIENDSELISGIVSD